MADKFATPGAIDLHVHLREPSDNGSETIESGTKAALLGGFVLVADMPNNPGMPVWNKERLDNKISIAEEKAWIPTAFYAGSQPESDNVGELANMAPHAIGLKLYGDPTTGNDKTYEAEDFSEIVSEWHRVAPDKPIMFHAGQSNLEDMIGLVAETTEHPLHICHVNHASQVDLVINAKEDDLAVTCGVCPHHLLKTSHDLKTQGVFAEMKPPLADQTDADNLMYLLARGYIDVVETDFAPHSLESKYDAENSGSHCYGVPGIEHVLPLLFYQVERGRISMNRLDNALYEQPAAILGVKFDRSTSVLWDASDRAYRIEQSDVVAGCGWSPYLGMLAIGRVSRVAVGGTPLVTEGVPFRKRPEVVEKRDHAIF